MKSNTNSFGFHDNTPDPWNHMGAMVVTEEYQSSINIDPLYLPLQTIVPDCAANLAYRVDQFIKQRDWQNRPVSLVLTLTIAPGDHVQSQMSVQQIEEGL